MIKDYLSVGKDNLKTGRQLANELHSDIRLITRKIEAERRNGIPICATAEGKRKGYFIADDPADIRTYCDHIGRRAEEIHKTRERLLETARIMERNKPVSE